MITDEQLSTMLSHADAPRLDAVERNGASVRLLVAEVRRLRGERDAFNATLMRIAQFVDTSDPFTLDEGVARLRAAVDVAADNVVAWDETIRRITAAIEEAHTMAGELQTELDDTHALILRQGALLTGVANALRGEPPALTTWSHHDVVERAKGAAVVVEAARAWKAETDNCDPNEPRDMKAEQAVCDALYDALAAYDAGKDGGE
jgi:hypothetical protein